MIADATHDEDLDVVVDARLEQEVRVPLAGRDRRDVQLVGAVEGDRRDAGARILLVEDDLLRRWDIDCGHVWGLLASRNGFVESSSGPVAVIEERLLAVHGAGALLPDVGGQRQHHAHLDLLLGGRPRQGMGHDGQVETEPQPPGHGHGRRRDPGGVVRVEEDGQRCADPARREEPVPQLVPAPEQGRVDGGVVAHRAGPAELPDVPAQDHPRLERHQVAALDRRIPAGAVPGVLARRDPRDVLPGGRRDDRPRPSPP